MKYFLVLGVVITLGLLTASCTKKQKPVPPGANLKEITLKVEGMTCGGCEHAVKTSLLKLDGVIKASADHKKGEATVSFIEGTITEVQLLEAVNKTGYKASLPK